MPLFSKPADGAAATEPVAVGWTADALPATDSQPGRAAPEGRRKLGDILVDAGLLAPDQLAAALASQAEDGGSRERLGKTIVRLGLASEEAIAQALSRQLTIDYVQVDAVELDPRVIRLLPAPVARRHLILPLRQESDGGLVVVAADPTNVVALDDVRTITGARSVRRVVGAASAVEAAVERAYGFDQKAAGELVEALEANAQADQPTDEELATAVTDAPVVRLAESIIQGALDDGASDLHVEPGARGTTVRYRIDGVLRTVMTVPRSASGALTSRLKLMAAMDIAERRRPQDGRSRLRSGGAEVDLRVSTMPSMFGETVVMRLLRKGDQRLSLGDVGFTDHQRARVLQAIGAPQGLILMTGPTGSGKTSTLYAFLEHLAEETRNIITLEDPVEYQLDGINQTQVNPSIGLSFAQCLRTVLRQDPDIVMVGEIRDPETAKLSLEAALTGHLVFSTLHTNDAPGAVVRLADLGIPPYLVASSLTTVIAQRLARRVCTRCAREATATEHQAVALHLTERELESAHLRQGHGCTACGGSGYRGRLGVFEVLTIDGTIRELVSARASENAIRNAGRRAGMLSLRHDAVGAALRGETTLDEVLRTTPPDVLEEGACPACAQPVDDDFALCPWCAHNLRAHSCARCDRTLKEGWVHCPSCGTPAAAD